MVCRWGYLVLTQFQGSSRLAPAVNRYGASVLECMCVGGGGGGLTSPIFAIDIEWQVQTLNSILVCEGGEETASHNSASFT